MSDYTALANGIKSTLELDPWVGNAANIKTIETYMRAVTVQGSEAPYFTLTELPALRIIPNLGKSQESRTVTLDTNAIRSQLKLISYHSTLNTAARNHFTALKNIEAVLDAQKTDSVDFGIGVYVRDVIVETERFKKGVNWFFESTIGFISELTRAGNLLFDDASGLFDDATGLFDDK